MKFGLTTLSCLTLALACKGTPAPRLGVVDSTRSRSEVLREYQSRFPEVTVLTGGAESRDDLAKRFMKALAGNDTIALSQLVISPAESAWLYYPTTRVSQPPYELAPELLWFQLDGQGRQGLGAALEKLGGQPLAYRGLDCPATPLSEGENRIWVPCTVRYQVANASEASARLFGPIIERGGRYKFVGLGNALD
jgi:hypothetical protein